MKKLSGIEVVEKLEIRENEFLFSTGEKMSFRMGGLRGKQVEKVTNRLVDHAYRIVKNSDKNVLLPPDLKSQMRDQVEELNEKGFIFRFYLRFGANIISEERLRALANPRYVFTPLWVPKTEAESYTVDELNGSESGISVMGAFQNAEKTGYDPTLLLLNHPYDDKYSDGKNITQQQASKEFVAEPRDDGLEPSQTDHRDVMSMYIMDRGDKVKSDIVIFAAGFMRVNLGRRSVGGYSYVGDVSSDDGLLKLCGSRGDACDGVGVGLSAGLAN